MNTWFVHTIELSIFLFNPVYYFFLEEARKWKGHPILRKNSVLQH